MYVMKRCDASILKAREHVFARSVTMYEYAWMPFVYIFSIARHSLCLISYFRMDSDVLTFVEV